MAGRGGNPGRADIQERRPIADPPVRLLPGERVQLTLRGPRIFSKYQVTGLTGSRDVLLFNAINAPGIPRLGSFHPTYAGAVVGNVDAEHMAGSPSKATVTIEYGFFGEELFGDDPSLQTLEVSSTVQPAVTNFDHEDKPIILVWETPPAPGEPGPTQVHGPPQVAEVEHQLPMPIVTLRKREEQGPGILTPGQKSSMYVGSINEENVFGDGPHYWMCIHLGGPTEDRGQTYNVTYQFQRHHRTWDPISIYRDPDTGLPIAPDIVTVGDVTTYVYPPGSIKTTQIAPGRNFHDLELSI